MLELKLQYFGHLMRRTDSLEKILMLGKIEGGRRGRQRMRWSDGIISLHAATPDWTVQPKKTQDVKTLDTDPR